MNNQQAKIIELNQNYRYRLIDGFGKEIHGSVVATNRDDAMVKAYKCARIALPDDYKALHNIVTIRDVSGRMAALNAEVDDLRVQVVKALDIVADMNKPVTPKKKKGK